MKQQRRRDERAREDATDPYLPVAQLRPPSAAHLQDQPRLPFRPTSPTPLSVPPRARSPPPRQRSARSPRLLRRRSARRLRLCRRHSARRPLQCRQHFVRRPLQRRRHSVRSLRRPSQCTGHSLLRPSTRTVHSPRTPSRRSAHSPPTTGAIPRAIAVGDAFARTRTGILLGCEPRHDAGAGALPRVRGIYARPASRHPSTTFSHPYASTCGRSRGTHRRDHRVQQQPARFDEHALPSAEQLTRAASLYVVAQNGLRVQFGDLFRDRKTVVCFIRHFWCPLCQDYMYSISRSVDPDALKRDGVDLVIIGNGSPGMIKAYRQIFHTPFALYTDQSLRLHAALGMTLRTTDAGPDTERGEYVRHGLIGGIAMVVRNALRVGMPVWEKGGDIAQLGGEFVFGPGLTCTYAHRMRTTRAHAPILHVLAAAGVRRVPSPASNDEDAWMAERRRSFARMRAKREKRRAPEQWCGAEEVCELEYGSDTGSASVHGSWGSRAEVEEGTLEEPLPPRREKRGRRGFHVVNPDGRQHARSHRGRAARGWESDAPRLAYSDENFGRTREDSYELTREVLNYSFGQA
ncbi:Thioredoxin-like protein AAED1 [Grifola frondosa]|uniref:Thioredoxin-like protein AAED1 n=1 Tax=Grifola frondosa TaxID=5627 RepID=A0A1C7M5L2_GRIFR|nr:Thioredoxin-like protein AAED1 [Grifola frondosa]